MSHYVVYHDGTLPRQLGNEGLLESACFRLTLSFLVYLGMGCPIRGSVHGMLGHQGSSSWAQQSWMVAVT